MRAFDLEKRARELLADAPRAAEPVPFEWKRYVPAALQLAREFAESSNREVCNTLAEYIGRVQMLEREVREAADARAEEIAQAIADRVTTFDKSGNVKRHAIEIARSFIAKPKAADDEAKLRADEREHENLGAAIACCDYILQWACPDVGKWRCVCPRCGKRYVHPLSGLPKSREQVLEDALRKIREMPTRSPDAHWMRELAGHALETPAPTPSAGTQGDR